MVAWNLCFVYLAFMFALPRFTRVKCKPKRKCKCKKMKIFPFLASALALAFVFVFCLSLSGGAAKTSGEAARGIGRKKLRNPLLEFKVSEFYLYTSERKIPIG